MASLASEHSLPPVYPSPSTTTRRDDGIEGVQEDDINTYAKFIDDKLEESTSANGRNEAPMFFIPKIPEILQRDKNDTGPKIISIGPNHRGKPWLQSMEDEKFRRLNEMLDETGLSSKRFVEVLAPLENQVRRCYSDTSGIGSEDFVEMMLLDSYFIIHLLSQVTKDFTKLGESCGCVYVKPPASKQPIPLMGLPITKSQLSPLQIQGASSMIGSPACSLPQKKFIIYLSGCEVFCTYNDHAAKYLEGQNYDEESGITIPSATALHEAGIKFKKRENSILDVNFSDGVLEIPHLLIQHGAVSVFQSLIALEQCLGFYNNNLPQFTVYFYFMDHIINTDSDVKLLQKTGIIEYAHGSEEEVADLFNQLTRGATINPNNYLSGLYKDVNRYCKKKRHIWRAIFLRRHCSNPWTILSLIGALILLVLAFIQSYFSVYAYFRPSSTSPS
ncbi:UPF0481 plant-like protein [Cinnamomum micranthum f. kanehirae]|uniref:UPF0481 plant-like protein n=1 Tax=Cinnamomum micranthum f. kanehirae TaxID=337451 RepID=A0A3S3MV15_9MAGN|nr:UPF0481 plant-like protein [Cinnamomum micranthum f. kanehirae]